MSEENCHRESVEAFLERIRRPRVPNGIQGVSRGQRCGFLVGQLSLRFSPKFGFRLLDRLTPSLFSRALGRNESVDLFGGDVDSAALHLLLAHSHLQRKEAAVHRIRRPGHSVRVAENRAIGVGKHQSPRDRQSRVGQVDDARNT